MLVYGAQRPSWSIPGQWLHLWGLNAWHPPRRRSDLTASSFTPNLEVQCVLCLDRDPVVLFCPSMGTGVAASMPKYLPI